jgi:hypothetical protein
LQKREVKLTSVFTKSEEEANFRANIQLQLREFRSQAQDLREDLESEREARKRDEKKGFMKEVTTNLRNEIIDQNDTSSIQKTKPPSFCI